MPPHYMFGRTSAGAIRPGGPRRPKVVKYKCRGPDGKVVAKRVNVDHDYEEPVALYYQHGDVWHLHTVIDAKLRPEWAKNYTETKAVKLA